MVWLLVKGVLRGRDVEFVLSDKGVEIRPSMRQQNLDRGMKVITRILFLLTYRGGQWSAWHPATRWKDVRKVEWDDPRREIVLRGGAWTLRLICGPDEYAAAAELVRARVSENEYAAQANKEKARAKKVPKAPAPGAVEMVRGGGAGCFARGFR